MCWSIRKLQSQSAAVRAELVKVFGEEVQFATELDAPTPSSDRDVVIALGVLLALSGLLMIITLALTIR